MQDVYFQDLGQMAYQPAWDYQEQLLRANTDIKAVLRNAELQPAAWQGNGNDVASGALPSTRHTLLFVEHPPVYTLGKSGDITNVLISADERMAKGIQFFNSNRGGDITFHGWQQLVAYPIFDLEKFTTDIGVYLRHLEEVVIRTLAYYGLTGERSAGETGVWLEPGIAGRERKICAIGVRCSRWVTMHGFAFNVNTDLSYFDYIIPCGIRNKQVTSLEKELGHTVPMDEVKQKVKHYFEEVFSIKLTG